jgi:hypothetical protein
MEERKKFDFSRYQLPKASKWYIIRTAFYIVILVILGILIFKITRKGNSIPQEHELEETIISPSIASLDLRSTRTIHPAH